MPFDAGVLRALRCPVCAASFVVLARSLRCAAGHAFDQARQGYVTLSPGRPGGHRGPASDSAEMVDARARFLAAGHYAPIADALAERAARSGADGGVVLDVGAGTGHYLAHLLDRLPEASGLALDLSPYAARRAARAHPRAAAIVADTWQPLPVHDASVGLVVDVFAPRNPQEFRRVLAPGGALLVVTPHRDHLHELVAPLGLISVDAEKDQRLEASLRPWFVPAEREDVRFTLRLGADDVRLAVAMGPSAHHVDADGLSRAIETLPEPFEVSVAVSVWTFSPRTASS